MARLHPNKAISAAIEQALAAGWSFEKAGPRAHNYGKLYCTAASRGGCIVKVYSTPRVPQAHARDIMREIRNCPHQKQSNESAEE